MKKFIKKIMIFLFFCIIISVIIPYAVDPYNVFHYNDIRDNGVEPNKNYVKMAYVIDHPRNFDSFMFGSSRVGAIHVENITDEKCYNMSYSLGVPEEHLNNIKTLVENGIIPKRIYLGVDSRSYTDNAQSHYSQPLRAPYEHYASDKTDFLLLYLNPSIVLKSLKTITSDKGNNDIFYQYGWWCDYQQETVLSEDEKIFPSIGKEMLLNDTLEDIKEIKALCDSHNIEFVVFTNPMHYVTYEASLDKNYYDFLYGLSQITPFYNFSGFNDVTLDSSNYIDESHYNAYIGDLILDCIKKGSTKESLLEQGFGVYVTENNVDDFLALLRYQEQEYNLK
ncbi:MAG: hypothetical protein IJZ94_00280 [Clostridia bacterium]|nr:hypothetical protein [Clostridia bacterium]